MITVQVDASKVILRFDRMPLALRTAIRGETISLTQALAARVRENLSGRVLNRRTGALYNSVKSELVENPSTVYGRVYVDPGSPAAKYAGIHEYGGIINHPGSDKFQAWQEGGAWVYTHKTRPHQIPIPQRSYMRSALEEMREQIVARLTAAAQRATQAA
jgi:phage gpG-like protein